jgi:hypothetical protein
MKMKNRYEWKRFNNRQSVRGQHVVSVKKASAFCYWEKVDTFKQTQQLGHKIGSVIWLVTELNQIYKITKQNKETSAVLSTLQYLRNL